MSTLSEFLLARVADDEDDIQTARYEGDEWYLPEAAHRERLRAECEAKRRIAELHEPIAADNPMDGREVQACRVCSNFDRTGLDTDLEPSPCVTLRLLALPYAEHDDYRDEWRP